MENKIEAEKINELLEEKQSEVTMTVVFEVDRGKGVERHVEKG